MPEKLKRSIQSTSKPEQEAIHLIAEKLGETNKEAIRSITRVVRVLGVAQAMELLNKALDIEAHGGMLTPDKSRRKTPGGVYFYAVRGANETLRRTWRAEKRKNHLKPRGAKS